LVIHFRVLEECDYSELKKKEIETIKKLNPILQNQKNDKMLKKEEKIKNVSEAIREYKNIYATF